MSLNDNKDASAAAATKELKKITVLSFDVSTPAYLSLCMELLASGYEVRCITTKYSVPLVQSCGLVAVSTSKSKDDADNVGDTAGEDMSKEPLSFEALFQNVTQELRENPPDLILSPSPPRAQYFAWYAAYKQGIPFMEVRGEIILHDPKRGTLGFPTLWCGLHRFFFNKMYLAGAYRFMVHFENVSDMKILTEKMPFQRFKVGYSNPTFPVLVLQSPEIPRAMYSDKVMISPQFKTVGCCIIDPSKRELGTSLTLELSEIKERIEAFLNMDDDSRPVIYMGWETKLQRSPQAMVELCARAIHKADVRAIVLGGVASELFGMEMLQTMGGVESSIKDYVRENVLFLEHIPPRQWLFPKVACTVHHGNALSTTAALRAGCPTIIVPGQLQQYDYGHVVRQMGVGWYKFEEDLEDISWKKLGARIQEVLASTATKEKAAAMAETLRKENGPESAALEIKQFWNDYCVTGKFIEGFTGEGGREN